MSVQMILSHMFCVTTNQVPDSERVFCSCEHTSHDDGPDKMSSGEALTDHHMFYARVMARTEVHCYVPAIPTGWRYVQGVEWDSTLCAHCVLSGHSA